VGEKLSYRMGKREIVTKAKRNLTAAAAIAAIAAK
jgi:hypothetical protein